MNRTQNTAGPFGRVIAAFTRLIHPLVKILAVLSLVWITVAAQSSAQTPQPFPPVASAGRIIVLPGIHNTLFHLNGFFEMTRASLPNFEIDKRKWGITFLGIRNLRAERDNIEFAQAVAADITQWRSEHPNELLYLMGYSGGGGVAALVVSELPPGVEIDRLILIAPAISADFPIEQHAHDHIREFATNFSSRRDIQVGLGTRLFGTIDRKYEYAAGYDGFTSESEKLAQWFWDEADRKSGHRGNHVAYLSRRWQRDFLLPALNPAISRVELEQLWQERRVETLN